MFKNLQCSSSVIQVLTECINGIKKKFSLNDNDTLKIYGFSTETHEDDVAHLHH